MTYTLEHRDASIHVLTDEPSRMVVNSDRIETKAWPTFRHYVKGIEGFHFSLFLQNTLRIALFSVIGTVLSSVGWPLVSLSSSGAAVTSCST